MAYLNKDGKSKASKEGISSKWDGMNPDGYSNQTYAPEPVSTPNKVGAEPKGKNGKGKIFGGIEEPQIFDDISYTGNTADFSKPAPAKSEMEKEVFTAKTGKILPPAGNMKLEGNVIGGNPNFAAGNKNDEGYAKKITDNSVKPVAPVKNVSRRHVEPEKMFNGKNPNSLNVTNGNKIRTTVFRGGGKDNTGVNA